MKIVPEVNNRIKMELDMKTYSKKKTLDIIEGTQRGIRFIDVSVVTKTMTIEPFILTFVDIHGTKQVFETSTVKIMMRKEK